MTGCYGLLLMRSLESKNYNILSVFVIGEELGCADLCRAFKEPLCGVLREILRNAVLEH